MDEAKLVGYIDDDRGESVDDMKSTSSYYVIILGLGIFFLGSKKQAKVAQSSVKPNHIAAVEQQVKQSVLEEILEDLGEKQVEPTTICDNKLAIAIAHSSFNHNMMKHIDIKYHFLFEATNNWDTEFKYFNMQE